MKIYETFIDVCDKTLIFNVCEAPPLEEEEEEEYLCALSP